MAYIYVNEAHEVVNVSRTQQEVEDATEYEVDASSIPENWIIYLYQDGIFTLSTSSQERYKKLEEEGFKDEVRGVKLDDGFNTNDGKFHFDGKTAGLFIQLASTLDAGESTPYMNKNGERVTLSYDEVKVYAKEIRDKLLSIYGVA
jgi:hypothetical protein